jgi:mannose-6-phosphate isomerase-like protein (cupin superfamily)
VATRRARNGSSFGVEYHYLANQQATGGDDGLYRVDIGPSDGGPGPHFHRAMSEAFFVLSGTMKLYNGSDWIDGRQGDFLYVPPGGVHGFRNGADVQSMDVRVVQKPSPARRSPGKMRTPMSLP